MIELFRIMPGRYSELQAAVEGYERTGMPLVSFREGVGISVSGFDADLGAYYIIPKIVETFGLSLDTSIQLVYTGTVVLAFVIGAAGSWLFCKTRIGKLISIVALAILSMIIAGIGDVYIFLGAIAMALVPWWLYVQEHCSVRVQLAFCMLAGLLIGAAHLMRSHSGTGVFIFITTAILLRKQISVKLKAALCAALVAGPLVAPLSFEHFVRQSQADFLTSIGRTDTQLGGHVFWHSLYVSLGFLQNPYGLELSDVHAVEVAKSINPSVVPFTAEYENILKNEVLRIARAHPLFVVKNVFVKFSVCLMYLLVFANVGFLLAIRYLKGAGFDAPFAAGIAFNMLFGVLVMPEYQYLLGLIALSVLYGVYSIDFAVDRGVLDRLRT